MPPNSKKGPQLFCFITWITLLYCGPKSPTIALYIPWYSTTFSMLHLLRNRRRIFFWHSDSYYKSYVLRLGLHWFFFCSYKLFLFLFLLITNNWVFNVIFYFLDTIIVSSYYFQSLCFNLLPLYYFYLSHLESWHYSQLEIIF